MTEVFFTKLGDKNKALEIFASVTNDAPDDYRGWWGIVRVRTDQFEKLDMTTVEFEDIQKLAQNAYTIAQSFSSESVQFQIESIWNTYEKRYNLRVANDRAALTSDKDGNLAEISDLNDEISRLRSQVTDIRGTVKSIQNRISKDADTDKRLILDPKIGNKWIAFIMCIALGLFSFYLMAYIGAYGLLILLAAVIAGIVFWKKISTNKKNSKEKLRLQIEISKLSKASFKLEQMAALIDRQIQSYEGDISQKRDRIEELDSSYNSL